MRPDAGENIGLNYKMGFQSAYPSLILKVPESIVIEDNPDIRVKGLWEMKLAHRKLILDNIDNWTQKKMSGLSFRHDLELAHSLGGEVLITLRKISP